jgi:alginate O-acetyltransferase complex protein AlgI
MLFNSYSFIFLYLPVVLIGFFIAGHAGRYRVGAAWLAILSLAFYGWTDPWHLTPLILTSISFNFIAGSALSKTRNRNILALAVFINLVALAYFKYTAFLISTSNYLTGWTLEIPEIALPIGISFYTFTQIAYLVDSYRGEAREYNPIHYLLFVTFFPHLIAGPILHHKEMMPQFGRVSTYRFNLLNFLLGSAWFTAGLFKKVILADGISRFSDPMFDAAASGHIPGMLEAWTGTMAYTLQLYFDFSGYSDMAIGLGLMFGIQLPLNFDSPYKASSLIDFWRRWHMTLSRFLRDYLYIPLGGNRRGRVRRHINLLVTMVLGGLWHGASWNFVLWGAIHGGGLLINHCWRDITRGTPLRIPAPMGGGINASHRCPCLGSLSG